ncbi:MAG: hypothetical protein ABSA67_14415 [Candidatus Brocadiia bacterium]|jgi:hypothetical protein
MLAKILALGLSAAAVAGLATPCWSQEKTVVIYTRDNAPAAPKLDELPLKDSVSQYGMTWTFDKPARVGQFVNGDFYVVGPVTITAITPKPLYGAEIPAAQLDAQDKRQAEKDRVRNGFMLNPPAAREVSYDSGVKNWFRPSLIQKLPVSMKPGDSLVSTISMTLGVVLQAPLQMNSAETESRGVEDASPVKDAAVLTCVAEPQPPDAFRPAFCDRTHKIYLARNLKRELLPAVAAPGDTPKLQQYIGWTRRPWVNTGFFGFEEPADNMPWYGREVGRVVGNAALLLCSNFTPQEKEPLLDDFVQVGIDLGGMVRSGHPGWYCFGGHGSGRKLPIVFAGLLLGDEELARVNKSFPKACFGEDEQTAYGDSWTGAKVVFTGHSGIDGLTGIGRDYARGPNAWGPYEHTPPTTWGPGQKTSESYRRGSTSVGWVAQALALRLLHAEKVWDHDAFFDYVDRWMYEKDDGFRQAIKAGAGVDYPRMEWCWQGQCPEQFVNEMWAKYRVGPGMPPTDGWKQQHDESYYKNAIAKELKGPAQNER